MNIWWNLIKKEYRMVRISTFISLALLLIAGLWFVYLSHKYNVAIIIAPASFILVLMVFYPAIYMLKSLSWEFNIARHLWLHCPQPAWMLLSAKWANCLLQMLVIMVVTVALILWGVLISTIPPEVFNGLSHSNILSIIFEVGFYAALLVVAAGIYLGAWATFISVVSAAAKNLLGRYRWLAGIAAFLIATWGIGQLQQTWFYQQVTRWGQLNFQLHSLQEILAAKSFNIGIGQLYTGQVLFYFLLTVALLALSAWLIDHKVEV